VRIRRIRRGSGDGTHGNESVRNKGSLPGRPDGRRPAGQRRFREEWSRLGQMADGPVVPAKPGNAGGGKGPWSKAGVEYGREPRRLTVGLPTPIDRFGSCRRRYRRKPRRNRNAASTASGTRSPRRGAVARESAGGVAEPDVSAAAPPSQMVIASQRAARHRVPPISGRVSLWETRPPPTAQGTQRPAESEGMRPWTRAGCGSSARPVRRAGCGNGARRRHSGTDNRKGREQIRFA
jgi:hypothetical protein